MRGSGLFGRVTVTLALAATCFSSTAAVAATRAAQVRAVPVQAVAPLVALSAFGSDFSRAALCGTATSGAAAAAGSASAFAATSTTAQPAPQAGCVLPIPDAAVAPIPDGPVAILPAPASYNIPWALLGAVGLIGALAIATLFHNDDEDSPFLPITPS